LARAVEAELRCLGCSAIVLDGDQMRRGLCADLGFTPEDRRENIRRAGEVARLLVEYGHLVICAFVSPLQDDRDLARTIIGPVAFVEVHVACSLEECRRRDPKGLYAAADRGSLAEMTGVGQPYEPPPDPDFTALSEIYTPKELATDLVHCLRKRGWISSAP
jgi:adenylyl-sulfate kinase